MFHTNAGHVTLHDIAYNADRNIATGNPYKELIGDVQKRGVQIELCGATAKSPSLGNCRSASRDQGKYGCYGENDAARSAGICENHGVSRRGRGQVQSHTYAAHLAVRLTSLKRRPKCRPTSDR